ncbi:WGxxGxxG family protein [Paenibacillus chungangensis]|uniref:WGxxGxxG family protein n=1 Tax=Paenibacillus chungangensis TaxID=696535 RepID=A0ABW3HW52_9BACL
MKKTALILFLFACLAIVTTLPADHAHANRTDKMDVNMNRADDMLTGKDNYRTNNMNNGTNMSKNNIYPNGNRFGTNNYNAYDNNRMYDNNMRNNANNGNYRGLTTDRNDNGFGWGWLGLLGLIGLAGLRGRDRERT